MKSPLGFLLLASMAYTGSAAPATEAAPLIDRDVQLVQTGPSGRGSGNIFGSVFDTAACIFSSFIGGAGCRRPTGGNTNSGGNSNSNSIASAYDFSYSTNSDGSYKIEITPGDKDKKKCSYDIQPQGRSIQDVVSVAATRCIQG